LEIDAALAANHLLARTLDRTFALYARFLFRAVLPTLAAVGGVVPDVGAGITALPLVGGGIAI
jgi:hypothetical protein